MKTLSRFPMVSRKINEVDSQSVSKMGEAASAYWLGTGVDYREAWEFQRHLAAERAAGLRGDTLLLLEHAAVYTAGRRSLPEHVLDSLRAPLVKTDRGGQMTYHGPGQLVGYPIIGLTGRGMGPRAYVHAIEDALIDTLAAFGVSGYREEGLTGVWTGHGKIAAIGVKISQGVTLHGFALNVAADLSAYDAIVPCGIAHGRMTSMLDILGHAPDAGAVRESTVRALAHRLDTSWRGLWEERPVQVPASHARKRAL